MARNIELAAGAVVDVQGVRETAVELLDGDGDGARVLAAAPLTQHVLLELQLDGVLLAVEGEGGAEAGAAGAVDPELEQGADVLGGEGGERVREGGGREVDGRPAVGGVGRGLFGSMRCNTLKKYLI